MPKPSSKKKAPASRDENEIASDLLRRLSGETPEDPNEDPEDEARRLAAKLLGSLGGRKGGPARAKKLSAKRRSEIAKKAASARWKAKAK